MSLVFDRASGSFQMTSTSGSVSVSYSPEHPTAGTALDTLVFTLVAGTTEGQAKQFAEKLNDMIVTAAIRKPH